jgi:hypothetical protein
MGSNTQNKTENMSSESKAEIPYCISFPVITTVLDVLKRNVLRPFDLLIRNAPYVSSISFLILFSETCGFGLRQFICFS